jgi:O-antigen/teichoic acid export membrane protein
VSDDSGGDDDGSSGAVSAAFSTVASGAAWVFGGRIVKILLLFGLQVLMARILGRTSYGGVVLAMMVISIVGTLSGLGINRGVTRKLPQYEDETPKARGVLRAGISVLLASRTLAGAMLFLAAPLLATRVFNDPDVTLLLRIGAISLPVTALGGIALSSAKSLRDARPHVVVNQVVKPVVRTASVGILVISYGAVGAMIGDLIAGIVGAIVALILAYRLLPFSIRGQVVNMRSELLRFSLPLMLSAGAGLIMGNTDTFLVGTFLASGAVGSYNVAFQLQEIGYFFFYPLSFLLPPVLTRLDTKNREETIRRTYQVTTKWMTLLTLPPFLAGFLFPEIVIGTTFGSEYIDATTAFRVLLVAPLLSVVMGANGKSLVALGHNKSQMYVNGASALLNLGLNLALIPRFGILGAALATTISLVFRDITFTAALYHWYSIVPVTPSLLKPVLGTVILAPLGYILFVSLFPVTLITVVAVGLLFFALYVPFVVWIGGIEQVDGEVLSLFEDSTGRDLSQVRSAVKRLQ